MRRFNRCRPPICAAEQMAGAISTHAWGAALDGAAAASPLAGLLAFFGAGRSKCGVSCYSLFKSGAARHMPFYLCLFALV